ncbi:hypothetical protein VB714_16580 [Spirulina sp. 06S082]|nr:hypothetical protein [Spirulina sp. 06S082]
MRKLAFFVSSSFLAVYTLRELFNVPELFRVYAIASNKFFSFPSWRSPYSHLLH